MRNAVEFLNESNGKAGVIHIPAKPKFFYRSEDKLKTNQKYRLVDYGMIIGVCVVLFLFGLFLKCAIIYNWFKERYFVKEKAINT